MLVVLQKIALERRGVRDHDVASTPADDVGPLIDHALELGHEGRRLLVRRHNFFLDVLDLETISSGEDVN